MSNMAPIPPVIVGGQGIQVFHNEGYFVEKPDGTKRKKNASELIANYLSEADGVFYFFQLCEKTIRAVVEVFRKMGNSMREFFEKLGAKFEMAWAVLTIPRLPVVLKDMVESIQRLRHKERGEIPGTSTRKAVEAIRSTSDAGAAAFYSVGFLTGSLPCIRAGDALDLTYNVADAQLCAQEMLMARKALHSAASQNVDVRIQHALQFTERHSFLKLIKAVCSVVAGILGLSILAFGGPLIPAIALIVVAVAGVVFSMWSSFYKASSPYEMVDFFRTRHVWTPVAA